MSVETKKYFLNILDNKKIEKSLGILDKYGICVIPNYINSKKINSLVQEFKSLFNTQAN